MVDECGDAKLPGKNYCDYHTCVICGDANTTFGKTFCDKHVCDICGDNSQLHTTTIKKRQLILCQFHMTTCAVLDCFEERSPYTPYCLNHRCAWDNCEEQAKNSRVDIHNSTYNLCDHHAQHYDNEKIWSNGVRLFSQHYISQKSLMQKGKYCASLLCMNRAMPKNVVCMDHYWKPNCLYCLSDGKCTQSCTHKYVAPCVDKRCQDVLYMRKHRTTHDYYLLSYAKYIKNNAPGVLIPQIIRIIAEYSKSNTIVQKSNDDDRSQSCESSSEES
jgi:hypothetical protein